MGRPTQSGGAGRGRPPAASDGWPPEYEDEGGDIPPGRGGISPDYGDVPPGHLDVPPGHGGGGLARGREPFERVYSAPEPPSAERRPKLLIVLVAVVSFALAAGAVFLLVPTGGKPDAEPAENRTLSPAGTGEPSASPSPKASSQPPSKSSAPTATASPAPQPSAKPFTALALPDACGTVSGAVLNRVAPGATKQANSNNTLATCTFTSKAPFRWLLVEMYLYPTANLPDAVGDARRNFAARWTQAHNTPLERTLTLQPLPGLGDEAFRSFQEDKGQPLVVGEVTARRGNVVIRVGYSRQLPSGTKAESVQQSALTNATDAAREVLSALR
ncbi:hypothetical protein AB0J52_08715 [Spirillospora sp. NPDC049652]